MTTKQYGISALLLILYFFLQVIPTSAEIYKYIDDNGIIHYTDNPTTIPPEYGQQLAPFVKTAVPATAISSEVSSGETLSSQKTASEKTEKAAKVETPGQENHATVLSETEPSVGIKSPPAAPPASSDLPDTSRIVDQEEPIEKNNNEAPDISGSDRAQPQEKSPSDLPVEASPPDVIGPTTEQVREIPGNETRSERIRQLAEQKGTLEEKVKQLDQQYRTILEERKRLGEQRRNLNAKSEIESYNQHVQQLNDKIQEYRNQRETLEFEVRGFNESLTTQ